MKEAYDDLIEAYTHLTKDAKRKEILTEIKKMTAIFHKVCSDKNLDSFELINKELLDLNKENVSEDDYLEALYVYVCWLKELTNTYLKSEEI